MNIVNFDDEERIEIKLLAIKKDEIGAGKLFEGMAGNLIAFAAKLPVKNYGANAAVSLVPKTLLYRHYMDKYGFEPAGKSLFLGGKNLWKLIKQYDYDK
jgi:hypothetical protein